MSNQQPTEFSPNDNARVDAIAAVVLILSVAGMMLLWVAGH